VKKREPHHHTTTPSTKLTNPSTVNYQSFFELLFHPSNLTIRFISPSRCLRSSTMSTGKPLCPCPRPCLRSEISSIISSSSSSSASIVTVHNHRYMLTLSPLARCTRSVNPSSVENLIPDPKPYCSGQLHSVQISNTFYTDSYLAILRCYGMHISNCLHLLRRCLRNRQVWCWNLRYGCSPTRSDCQEYGIGGQA